jgi:D-psicose/D-tagatose/L-ribulose 3-epimerase
MFKFGVDTFIWAENFTEKDLPLIGKAKKLGFEVLDIAIAHPEVFPTKLVRDEVKKTGIEVVTSTTLNKDTNLISPDPGIRSKGMDSLKKLVDINVAIGSKILGGVNYAAWGYFTGKPRTMDEWKWSVEAMREVALYAKDKSDMIIAVEAVNRFETHFLNIADDAVAYCSSIL